MKKYNRCYYFKFILIWIIPLALIVIYPGFPDKLQYAFLSIVGIVWLFISATIVRLFESWKSLYLWEELPYGVGKYIEKKVVRKEAEKMISDSSYLEHIKHTRESKNFLNKYDEICSELRRYSELAEKEANDWERLHDRLTNMAKQ